MIYDSHCHVEPQEEQLLADVYERAQMGVLLCAGAASELQRIQRIKREKASFYTSFGIHPWRAEAFGKEQAPRSIVEAVEALQDCYRKADSVGEIGMDSCWCEVDLTMQRQVFLAQMEMAQSLQKPVILHCKGQERQVAELIRPFSVRKLVHWHSCHEYLEDFLDQDCYLTIGPDFDRNPAVRAVIQTAPLHRLLVETDGLAAVCWAKDRQVSLEELPELLRQSVAAIAKEKEKSVPELEQMLADNFSRFLIGE